MNTAEIVERKKEGVARALELLGDGVLRRAAVAQLVAQYGISQSTSYEWVAEALRELLPKTKSARFDLFADIHYTLLWAQRTAMEAGDVDAVCRVVDRRTKLYGLNQERPEIYVERQYPDPHLSMTSGDRRRRIEQMIADALKDDVAEEQGEEAAE